MGYVADRERCYLSLRLGTLDDVDFIVDTILNARDEFVQAHLIEVISVRTFLLEHLNKPRELAISLVATDTNNRPIGLLLGLRTIPPLTQTPVAIEVIWWVDPKYRRFGVSQDLKDAFENWAKLVGCHYLQFTASNTAEMNLLSRYYKMNGFVETERNFLKAI